jgi:ribosomal protein S6--L-glutamate ligase
MNIAIMSRNSRLYSTRRLKEAAEARGHEVRIVDPLTCYMNINMTSPSIHVKGLELPRFDAVIPRIGASITFYGTAVLRQFEMMGVQPLNESVAITRSRDKLRSLQLLSRKNIGLPVTGFASKPTDVPDLLDMVGGAPCVIKLLEGTQGIGVVLAETRKAAESVIEAFMGLKANIMVQEYISEAGGADIRCFVIGDKVIAAMKRQGAPGEFRSNLHRGGSATLVKLSPEERSTAVRAAKTMGLNVAGVDLLRSMHGPLVMEVNSSPGLEGIENATGIDIAGKIISFLETNQKHHSTKTKGTGQGHVSWLAVCVPPCRPVRGRWPFYPDLARNPDTIAVADVCPAPLPPPPTAAHPPG